MEPDPGGPDVVDVDPGLDVVEVDAGPDVVEVDPGLDHLAGGLYSDAAAVLDDDPDGVDGVDGLDDPVTAEVDIDESLLDSIEQELADVERALALLDDGTYGQCEACGRAVDDAVLARTPTARFCAEHLPLSLR